MRPQLSAVAAHRWKAQRREQGVEIGNQSPAHQRQGPSGVLAHRDERLAKPRRHLDRLRSRRDVEQRAVDIEQNGKAAEVAKVERHRQVRCC